jgi:AraC-like DNA-binding protein
MMATSWTIPSLPGLECFRAVRLTQQYARHSHEQVAIGAFERGVGATRYRGARWIFPPDHIVAMNPDEVHTGSAAGDAPITYRMFYVDDSFFERAPRFPDVCISDPQWAARLLRLHRFLERNDDALASDVVAIETLGSFAARYGSVRASSARREPQAIVAVKDYLRDHRSRRVTLGDLTELTGLSREYLIRTFRRSVGMPPHAWHLQLRVETAKSLLASGTPIADAAIEAGFADQSHLTRRFRALTGVTPGQFVAGHFHSRPQRERLITLRRCGTSQRSTSRD